LRPKLDICRVSDVPRTPNTSTQTLAVLVALLEAPAGWHHGYALMQATALGAGTVYPILARLAGTDLLETRWEDPERSGRAPRHLYRLSASGLAAAREARAELARREAVREGRWRAARGRA
jgi:PadR family transcriptional regulator PadR